MKGQQPEIQKIVLMLEELSLDSYVPQNVRSRASEVSAALQDSKETIEARKNRALQHLEGMAFDSNIDISTRTSIYQTLSLVESLGNDKQ